MKMKKKLSKFLRFFILRAEAKRVPTTVLVNKIYDFCEFYGNRHLFPYQEQFGKRIIRSVLENDGAEITALFARQSGKCFAKGTKILMHDGSIKRVENIKVGDKVMKPYGMGFATVTALGRGKEEMYEVKSREKHHESFTVNKSHILAVVDRKGKYHTFTVEEYLKLKDWQKKNEFRGYRTPVEYEEFPVDVEPYFLGLWVGDGTRRDVSITNVEKEVIDYLYDYADRLAMSVSVYKTKDRVPTYAITNGNIGGKVKNPIRSYLEKNKMFEGKCIPNDILLNSRRVRLQFLAGLIDSDGYKSNAKGKENVLELSTSKILLANQYVRLLRSLGFRASKELKYTNCGEKRCKSYRVLAYGDFSSVPCKVERKKWKNVFLRENPLTFGFDLIPKGVGEYYGFTIDSADRLFLLSDYTVVHNTETVALIVGGLMIILPVLANMPMFADDTRFQMFKQGIWVGIYAPGLRQAQINYNRMRAFLTCPTAIQVLMDDDFRLNFDTNNGNTVSLSNGSYAKAVSASEQSNIEGESYHLIICEEAQDISDYKLTKSIHPMGAAYNATVIDVGTATTFTAYFYRKINQNKEEAKSKSTHIRNHFEYDYLVACKYNERYKKYVEREKKSLGENSDEFQMSYCVAPSTRILTADLRYIRADEVKVGDKLFAFDEFNEPHRQRNARMAQVEAVGKIIRPCYKLTFDDGTVITCSKEHQWLVQSHGSARRCFWKKTEELSFNDSFFRIADRWEDLDIDNYALGYLAAAFDGEGCVSIHNGKLIQLSFTQKDNAMLHKVIKSLDICGFDYFIRFREYDNVYVVCIKGGKYEYLRFLGKVRPVRLLDKFTPEQFGTIRTCKHTERGFRHPKLVKKEYVGLKTVIPIRTDTHTYVAEGIATHNCLKWMLHRGMLIELEKFERENTEPALEVCEYDKSATHVIGIDLGGGEGGDSTVLTAVEVDWSMPVVNESRVDEESGEELTYTAYNTYIKAWLEIRNLPDYEEQYSLIREFISHFRVARVVCDATREKSVSDRLAANLSCEVIPYVFGPKSKSDLYRKFISEIDTGRARVPYGEKTIKSPEYLRFIDQLGSMQKGYSGSYIVCSHPPIKGAHDDYPDSWALAVWGASYEGDTLMVETCDRRKLMELKTETNFQRRVKRLTARRR